MDLDTTKGNLFDQVASFSKEALAKIIDATKLPFRRRAITREFEERIGAHQDILNSIEEKLLVRRIDLASYTLKGGGVAVCDLLIERDRHMTAIKILKEERFIMLGIALDK